MHNASHLLARNQPPIHSVSSGQLSHTLPLNLEWGFSLSGSSVPTWAAWGHRWMLTCSIKCWNQYGTDDTYETSKFVYIVSKAIVCIMFYAGSFHSVNTVESRKQKSRNFLITKNKLLLSCRLCCHGGLSFGRSDTGKIFFKGKKNVINHIHLIMFT